MKNAIGIIGGGASGLVSAIALSRALANKNNKMEIYILERKDRVGKKILATGNGRCNISNINLSIKNYYGNDLEFINNILKRYNTEDVISFFNSIGLMCKIENDRVYPYSNSSLSVLDCLRNEIEFLKINEITNFHVESIKKEKEGFKVISKDKNTMKFLKIIITTGGCSNKNLGSDGSGFKILKDLGHDCTDISEALVPLKVDNGFKSLKGIKVKALVSIKFKEKVLKKEYGEILFTDYGFSGIAIMNLSKFLRDYKNLYLEIDFLKEYTYNEVLELLYDRKEILSKKNMLASDFFIGMLNKNLGSFIIKNSVKSLNVKISDFTDLDIENILKNLKSANFKVLGNTGFLNSQVTYGGALTNQFDNYTLESKIHKNLYVAGEVLDVAGDCGGYNLHFAFASGLIAGHSCGIKGDNI